MCDLSLVAEDAKRERGPDLIKTNQLSVYLTDSETTADLGSFAGPLESLRGLVN